MSLYHQHGRKNHVAAIRSPHTANPRYPTTLDACSDLPPITMECSTGKPFRGSTEFDGDLWRPPMRANTRARPPLTHQRSRLSEQHSESMFLSRVGHGLNHFRQSALQESSARPGRYSHFQKVCNLRPERNTCGWDDKKFVRNHASRSDGGPEILIKDRGSTCTLDLTSNSLDCGRIRSRRFFQINSDASQLGACLDGPEYPVG